MRTISTTFPGRTSPLDRTPTTYCKAQAFLGGRHRRKAGNNTYVTRADDGALALVIHSTPDTPRQAHW